MPSFRTSWSDNRDSEHLEEKAGNDHRGRFRQLSLPTWSEPNAPGISEFPERGDSRIGSAARAPISSRNCTRRSCESFRMRSRSRHPVKTLKRREGLVTLQLLGS